MQVEPVHQLALALTSSPRLLACVLGSGVSRAANVRTGWEITLDFVAKHAAQIGESESAAVDPAAWYAAKYGGEPDYSEVVSKLAPTTDLRRNLLEPYFTVLDPVTGERREHPPTAAHHAIAQLVKRGLVRVIVTTNFDRLMENALREAGVASIEVVSSDEEAANRYRSTPASFVFGARRLEGHASAQLDRGTRRVPARYRCKPLRRITSRGTAWSCAAGRRSTTSPAPSIAATSADSRCSGRSRSAITLARW
jgi:hypothetical protein